MREQRPPTLAPISEDDSSGEVTRHTCDHLSDLKATALRLKLPTRRLSYVAWRTKILDKPQPPRVGKDDIDGDKLTEERKIWINNAIEWLRCQLTEMRSQDQSLARQLLSIKHDIHQLKLRKSCEEHREMLENAQCELEELGELSEICDLPPERVDDFPLRHLGVTRMNITARRFSTC